jgi:RNA recognition motif-containing protein
VFSLKIAKDSHNESLNYGYV